MSTLGNIIPESSLIKRKRSSFTKSLELEGTLETGYRPLGIADNFWEDEEFSKSVHILSHQDGSYEIYKGTKSNSSNLPKKSFKTSIKNYFLWLKGSTNKTKTPKYVKQNDCVNFTNSNHGDVNCQLVIGGNSEDGSKCSCLKFHHHTFQNRTFFLPSENTDSSELDKHFSTKHQFLEANQRHLNVCNTFWRPSLSLNQQSYANRNTYHKHLLNFESLWPEEASLKTLLSDGLQSTSLRDAISELALLAVVCGPVHLLESLVNLSLVRLDCHLEDGQGLLHYACLMQRTQLINYLTKSGVLSELPDRRGYTADETCFNEKIWKQLPSKYHINTTSCPSTEIEPTIHDRSVLFRMVQMTGNVYEIQINLQTLNFNVNTECNKDGDFLIHVAVRGGLCQLPLIMTLIQIQHADIELCNSKGMTPLMIAAQAGNSILCDLLICVLGADPNKVNVENGRSALHYAAQNNHEDVVSCLIKRGSDLNHEDYHGCLPDDVPIIHQYYTSADCQQIIQLHRQQRQQALDNLIKNGQITEDDLVESDLCTVDEDGYTLMMLAARHNSVDSLDVLLKCSRRSIDAQYSHKLNTSSFEETGMTALAMAAQLGHKDAVKILLQNGGNPSVADICGYLPLHHSVINEHEETVDVILNFFPDSYKGLKKAEEPCDNPSLKNKLHQAWIRRQEEIVSPGLFEFSIDGKADQLYCLLEDGDTVDCKSGFGSWPLYLAIQNGYLDVITLLCEKGADLRKRHLQTGNTVLHLATSLGRVECLEYLLNFCKPHFGVDVGRSEGNSRQNLNINAINGCHKTALQLAAEKGYLKIVRILLNHGATTAILDAKGNLFSVHEFEGVWSEVASYRQKHTDIIMSLIEKSSKQNFEKLKHTWVPGFDHNLRNHHGDTPLMVACSVGNLDVVLFLLQSAVYPQSFVDDASYLDNFSDNDSGVLDEDITRVTVHDDDCKYLNEVPEHSNTSVWTETTVPSRVDTLLSDIDKPVGLSIYRDSLISHVCAVNTVDRCTALHRCLEKGDNSKIVELLLKIDDSCVNIQNSSGFTPLHLACKLERKKCVEILSKYFTHRSTALYHFGQTLHDMVKNESTTQQVNCVEVDLNIPTLEGNLPEEMTDNKYIIKTVQNIRRGNPVRGKQASRSRSSSVTTEMSFERQASTVAQSTINLEKVRSRFEALKQKVQKKS